jgi:hypothetical protein
VNQTRASKRSSLPLTESVHGIIFWLLGHPNRQTLQGAVQAPEGMAERIDPPGPSVRGV